MKEAFDHVLSYIEGAESIVVEAAHIYANQEPGPEQIAGARIAADFIRGVGKSVTTTLFIDDFNAPSTTLDYKKYLAFLEDYGFSVDNVVFESDLVADAHALLKSLKLLIPGKKLSPKHINLTPETPASFWSSAGRIPLITASQRPSCALLDASLYLRKTAGQNVAALTILPESYYPQQLATAAVLRTAQTCPSIANLFFNPETGTVRPHHLMSKTTL